MTWYQSVIRWNFDEETPPILTNLAQEEWTVQVIATEPTDISSGGSRGGARGAQAPPLFLDQTEAQRAENFFFGHRPPPLSKGLDDHPPPPPHPLSEGLDPTLIRELKQRRRRRQRERQKCNRLNKQNNNLARASCFFVHFFTVTPRLRRGTAYFDGLWRTWTQGNDFLFFSCTFIQSFRIQLQKKKKSQQLANWTRGNKRVVAVAVAVVVA